MAKRNEIRAPLCALLVTLAVVAILAVQAKPAVAYGYPTPYTPAMQKTVSDIVKNAIYSGTYNGGRGSVGAALIRLLFHDCWVMGCDASVLLDQTTKKGPHGTEKYAGANIGLGGFEVIDAIKKELGDGVSCADIVVFAAREATFILSNGKIDYTVEGGRGDGVYSSADDADYTLPAPTFNLAQLNKNFADKGFSQEELVVLSGAHAVGAAHFSSFQDRLSPDPAVATPIDGNYLNALKKDYWPQSAAQLTLNPTEKNNIRDMPASFQKASRYDAAGVDTAAVGKLDNSYYDANIRNMVLFKSDWVLRTDQAAEANLHEYKNNATAWNLDFAEAMAKLSKLPPYNNMNNNMTYLETRTNCRKTNKQDYY